MEKKKKCEHLRQVQEYGAEWVQTGSAELGLPRHRFLHLKCLDCGVFFGRDLWHVTEPKPPPPHETV